MGYGDTLFPPPTKCTGLMLKKPRIDFKSIVCLLVWGLSSNSSIFDSYGDVIMISEGMKIFKDGALSAFLPPVGRRSFRSCKLNFFLYSEQLCFEIISLITNNKILKRLFNFLSI
mgnify:CR=1 FL=1